MEFTDLYLFLVSMLIGALIGTERQRRIIEEKITGVAGLRTFILIALLGTLSANMAGLFGTTFLLVAFGGFIILVGIAYATSARLLGYIDFTSAVTAVITFILGAMCYFKNEQLIAAALAIIITWVLATRKVSHRYVESISETELLDTLKMGIIAVVILPILPDRTIDPFDALNPRSIWMMVVLVSIISYSGYLLIKILGPERGLSLTGFLGGLVSSTAVTMTMATDVRLDRKQLSSAAFATAIASCTMFPRILLIALVLNRPLFMDLLAPLIAMGLSGTALAFMLHRRDFPFASRVEHKDPFRLTPALKFGAFFALILLTSTAASTYLGNAGIYMAGIISGLAEMDAITLSMATLAGKSIDLGTAVDTIILGTMTNTLVKLSIAYIMGSLEFALAVSRVFLPMFIVGILAILIA